MLERLWRKGNPLTLLVGMQVGTATLENSVKVPQKLKNRATLWPSNCTTGYLPQRHRCSEKKGHMHPNVHSSNVRIAKAWKEPRWMDRLHSSNRWMDKEDVAHIYNGILLSHQKRWIPNFYINMDGTGGDYAKWNKSSRESQLSYGFTYLWNIRNNMEDIRRRKGKMGGGNWRERWTMRDYGPEKQTGF